MKNPILRHLALPMILVVLSTSQLWAQNDDRGKSDDAGFSTAQPLNDEERHLSETYVHEGLARDVLREECQKSKNKEACTDQEASVISPEADMAVDVVAKVYTLFSAAGVGGAGNQGGDVDYCGLVPSATELAAQSYQSFQNQEIALPLGTEAASSTRPPQNKQRESLEALRRSHNTRADAATMQTGGWGATAACYTGMLATGNIPPSKGTFLKLGGAVLLTGFYGMKVKRHKEYSKKVKDIIKKLPQAGECNPITENNCYCNHPTTANDPEHCLPQIYAKRAQDGGTVTSCVDRNLQVDDSCNCLASNSCFDTTFKDITVGKLGTLSNSGLFKGFEDITRGRLDSGRVTSAANQQLAIANRAIKNNAAKLASGLSLNEREKAQARALTGLGIEPVLAANLAKIPETPKSRSIAQRIRASGASGLTSLKLKPSGKKFGESKVLYFGGGGLKGNQKSRSSRRSRGRKSKVKKGKKNPNVLNFASKAASKADVNRDSTTNIFQIISRRYQLSGPKED